ncbi:MAG: hypothetical protein CSA26_09715 [Desulfobacterales bacterium]|nr:MAG: hypothetical protein CSA26_09715 [Desulfobacterales bacterium]
MFMTAGRIKINGKPALKLYMHEFDRKDEDFLDKLGIDQQDEEMEDARYILVHSQDDFLALRETIFQSYDLVSEKGPIVTLKRKEED